jgi:uncharacterized membrane protein
MSDTAQILPTHVQDTIDSISKLHAGHRHAGGRFRRAIAQLTEFFARPRFIGFLTLALLAWFGLGGALALVGRPAIDSWLFQGLQSATSIFALYMTVFILMTQRHEDELAELRGQLTLELSILSEQKIAKVIELLEELRRDLPSVRDRGDPEADALAQPADQEAVLAALKEVQLEAKSASEAPPDAEP